MNSEITRSRYYNCWKRTVLSRCRDADSDGKVFIYMHHYYIITLLLPLLHPPRSSYVTAGIYLLPTSHAKLLIMKVLSQMLLWTRKSTVNSSVILLRGS